MGKLRKGEPAGEAGFTLIEIVMVLVLLGILAAVAVPKYFDLEDEANKQAALASVAEAQARIHARFADAILRGDTCQQAVDSVRNLSLISDDEGRTALFGEFVLEPSSVSDEANGTEMSATKLGHSVLYSDIGILYLPQCRNDQGVDPISETTSYSMATFSVMVSMAIRSGSGAVGERWDPFFHLAEGQQINTQNEPTLFAAEPTWFPNGGAITKLSDGSYEVLIVDHADPNLGLVQKISSSGAAEGENWTVHVTLNEGRYVY